MVNEIIDVHHTNYIDKNIIEVALNIACSWQNIVLVGWINQVAKDRGIIITNEMIEKVVNNTLINSMNKRATTENIKQFYESIIPLLHPTYGQN